MSATTRFAPSPTGALHLGHAYSALFAAAHGTMLLRHEDIDPGRARAGHIAGIEADLAWLGLDWPRPALRPSTRLGAYGEALETIGRMGLTYPCFCTRRDIAASASAPHGPEGAPYPGTCRTLPFVEAGRRIFAGERPAVRLNMAAALAKVGPLAWQDAEAGPQIAATGPFGDVVLARKGAPASYHLAVIIDDPHQGVTLVTRSRDLFGATHVHRLLQALLGLPTPAYHHQEVLTGPDGERLAKRDGAPALARLGAAGVDPRDLARDLMALAADENGAMSIPKRYLTA